MKFVSEAQRNRIWSWLVIILLLVILGLTLTACNPIERFNDWIGWSDDHIGEEVTEMVIKQQTGADLDLTPRSPE